MGKWHAGDLGRITIRTTKKGDKAAKKCMLNLWTEVQTAFANSDCDCGDAIVEVVREYQHLGPHWNLKYQISEPAHRKQEGHFFRMINQAIRDALPGYPMVAEWPCLTESPEPCEGPDPVTVECTIEMEMRQAGAGEPTAHLSSLRGHLPREVQADRIPGSVERVIPL